MTLPLSVLAIHVVVAVWATMRSSRLDRWAGGRRSVAIAFAWFLPALGPVVTLVATIGTTSASHPNLRHAVICCQSGTLPVTATHRAITLGGMTASGR